MKYTPTKCQDETKSTQKGELPELYKNKDNDF